MNYFLAHQFWLAPCLPYRVPNRNECRSAGGIVKICVWPGSFRCRDKNIPPYKGLFEFIKKFTPTEFIQFIVVQDFCCSQLFAMQIPENINSVLLYQPQCPGKRNYIDNCGCSGFESFRCISPDYPVRGNNPGCPSSCL